MATIMTQPEHHRERTVIGGPTMEALAGGAAIVLAIIGLAGIEPRFMVSVSAIALGAAFVFDGGMVATEYSRILSHSGGTLENVEFGGGLSAQVIAGIAVVVLCVLSLLNLDALVLTPIAAIVLGAAMVFSSGVSARLNTLKIDTSGDQELAKQIARQALSAATGLEVLVGLSAVVLGILALIGIGSMTLTLVAMLSLGASILLGGTAISGKMVNLFTS